MSYRVLIFSKTKLNIFFSLHILVNSEMFPYLQVGGEENTALESTRLVLKQIFWFGNMCSSAEDSDPVIFYLSDLVLFCPDPDPTPNYLFI